MLINLITCCLTFFFFLILDDNFLNNIFGFYIRGVFSHYFYTVEYFFELCKVVWFFFFAISGILEHHSSMGTLTALTQLDKIFHLEINKIDWKESIYF